VNPRHPLIKELLRRVEDDPADPTAKDMALMMFRTATLRSGYMLKDTSEFAASVETMMRKSLGISLDEMVGFCCCVFDFQNNDDVLCFSLMRTVKRWARRIRLRTARRK